MNDQTSNEAPKIDQQRTIALARAIMLDVRAHYQVREGEKPERMRVYEVLNAVAWVTATVLAGTAPDKDRGNASEWPTSKWFLDALFAQLAKIEEEPE